MSEPPSPVTRVDERELFRRPLEWRDDREHLFWFKADDGGETFYLRLNTAFPDEPLYSLLVDEDETVDFDEYPQAWRYDGDYSWGGAVAGRVPPVPTADPGAGKRRTPDIEKYMPKQTLDRFALGNRAAAAGPIDPERRIEPDHHGAGARCPAAVADVRP